jgi:hypothetical protein
MRTLLECPRRFKLIMDGWALKYTPIYFITGQLFHIAAEKIILGTGFETEDEVNQFVGIFDDGEYYDDTREVWVRFDNEILAYKPSKKTGKQSPITKAQQNKKILRHLITEMRVQKVLGQFENVKETEVYREVQVLIDPVTGQPDDESKRIQDAGLVFTGRLDIKKDGDVPIEDLKTAKDGIGNLKGGYSNQIGIYGYLDTVTEGRLVEHVGIHGFKKNVTKSDYAYEVADMTIEKYVDTFEELKMVGSEFIRCQSGNKWPKRGYLASGCKDMYNQRCPYHPVCFPDAYSDLKEAQSTLIREN